MVKLLLQNSCDAPVLLRNFMASETTRDGGGGHVAHTAHAELPCSVDAGSANRCASLQPGEALLYDGMDKLESTAFQFSWDEEKQLGYQLPCANYTFCQGLETQAFGKSLNFDNQLGYSLPLGVSFLDADGKPVESCLAPAGPGLAAANCDFDTRRCPGGALRVFDPYGPGPGTKGFSYEYCVSPDSNRACVSSPARDPADNPKDAAQCGRPPSVLCGVPGAECRETDAWCRPRGDVWDAVDKAAGKRASAALDKVLLQASPDARPTRPGREAMLAKFDAGAMEFQEAVNLACKQGATYNYDGSLTRAAPGGLAAGELRLPAEPNVRRPNSRGEGRGFALTYECDGVNQFIPKAWLAEHGYPSAQAGDFGVSDWLQQHAPPPARVDMAANVGLKCEQHEVVKVTFCPDAPGPRREGEAAVEAFLRELHLGVRPCSEFPGFDAAHNWGNCGRSNRGGAWACPAAELGQSWQCNVEDPFSHVQEGGGCAEYCRFTPAGA